jgi:hypothetical protein
MLRPRFAVLHNTAANGRFPLHWVIYEAAGIYRTSRQRDGMAACSPAQQLAMPVIGFLESYITRD